MATAFAVFCATDGSLIFYNRDVAVPAVGDTFEGKTVSAVYTGWDTATYDYGTTPWVNEMANDIFTVYFADKVSPKSTAYWFCFGGFITTLDVTNLDTSNVTNMAGMFTWCNNLLSLNVSNFDTSKVTNMDGMFYGCDKLTSLDVSNFDTSNVTSMQGMFDYCYDLISLDLSNFDTSKVTDMGYMFENCYNLITIYVSDRWSTDDVTSSTDMFIGCASLVGAVPYDSTKTDATMANYETGYFTYKFYADYFKDRFVLDGSELNAIADGVRKLTGAKDGMTPTVMTSTLDAAGVEVVAQTELIEQILAALGVSSASEASAE